MNLRKKDHAVLLVIVTCVCGLLCVTSSAQDDSRNALQAGTIGVSVNSANGAYTIFDPASKKPMFHAAVAAEIDHRWIRSSDYPHHSIRRESSSDELGSKDSITIANEGLANQPDLICSLHLHSAPDFVTITVMLKNTGTRGTTVQAIRSLEATGSLDLGGSDADDRVLSDSFSEDRPGMVIHDLPDATNGMHRAVGSQMIYNRNSKRALFLGTLSSDKFLTILRLHVDKDHIASYEVDSTGTLELEKENSLQDSPPEDQIELSLPLGPGAELSSERLLISAGTDYLTQLENYGGLIRQLHHPRVVTPVPAGWELDGVLFRSESGNGSDQCEVVSGESEATRLQLLSYRRGIPVRTRRIHHAGCNSFPRRHARPRAKSGRTRIDPGDMDRSLRGFRTSLGL